MWSEDWRTFATSACHYDYTYVAWPHCAPFALHAFLLRHRRNSTLQCHLQVDVVFEEVDEIVLQDPELPFIAGRLAEPVQPNLVRMRELLSASKYNVVLVDGDGQVGASLDRSSSLDVLGRTNMFACTCFQGASPFLLFKLYAFEVHLLSFYSN